MQNPSSQGTLNVVEERGLAYFQTCTSRNCSGWLDFDFWNILVLQLARTSKVVMHSLVALSALHERLSNQDPHQNKELLELDLTQSIKASVAARATNVTRLEALVSCLVVLCSQDLARCPKAFRLLRSGLWMLEEHDQSGQHDPIFESTIRPLFVRLHCRFCIMGDAVASLRMSLQTSSKTNGLKPTIPHQFAVVRDARISLLLLFQWWQAQAYELDRSCLRIAFDAWQTALQASAHLAIDATAVQLLLAASLSGQIMMEASLTTSEMIFDSHTGDFDRVVGYIENVVKIRKPQMSFGIDGGVVDILAFVGTKCRDPCIRRRALKLLLESGRSEGDRVAFIPGKIMEALIELEERGLHAETCSDVPETGRFSIHKGHRFNAAQLVRLFLRNAAGGWIIEHTVHLGPGGASVDESRLPDAKFGAGYAAFLDDQERGTYYEVQIKEYAFPIPRV